MSLMLVHPFPPTTSSPPHLSPNHGSQDHQVPLPSPEGCGPSPLIGEYARGRGTKGDPGGASRKRATTKVVARFISLFVWALTTHANTGAGAKPRPHDDVEGPSTTRRAQMTTRRAQ